MYTNGNILIFGIVFFITIIGIFNRFVKNLNRVNDVWSHIDVAQKWRKQTASKPCCRKTRYILKRQCLMQSLSIY